MIGRLKLVTVSLKYFGWYWLYQRIKWALMAKVGVTRKKISYSWDSLSLPENAASFISNCDNPLFGGRDIEEFRERISGTATNQEDCLLEASEILKGDFRLFEGQRFSFGSPVSWFQNKYSGEELDSKSHWSFIDEFGEGDIKAVWEISRFSWAITLARAYVYTKDERYAERFWELLDSWLIANQPMKGVNWKCGQESTIRLMSTLICYFVFRGSPSDSVQRREKICKLALLTGERVFEHIEYAISQRNNHAISEAMGLWMIGTLFPEFSSSARWCEKGRGLLINLPNSLVLEGGGFAQYSCNYHRMVCYCYLWVSCLSRNSDPEFNGQINSILETLSTFIDPLIAGKKGEVPNMGQNDGSNILKLHSLGYHNFRPLSKALSSCKNHYERKVDWSAEDELSVWLFGFASESPNIPNQILDQSKSGYVISRSADDLAFLRVGEFKYRPSQSDIGHFDLWFDGINIAMDPGTFSYNRPKPWDNPFALSKSHNTFLVDSFEPMEKVSRFLFAPWIGSSVKIGEYSNTSKSTIEITHDGFRKIDSNARYRRSMTWLEEGILLLVDAYNGSRNEQHKFESRFLLHPDLVAEKKGNGLLNLKTTEASYWLYSGSTETVLEETILVAKEDGVEASFSPGYLRKLPSTLLSFRSSSISELRYHIFSKKEIELSVDGHKFSLQGSQLHTIELNTDDGPLVSIA